MRRAPIGTLLRGVLLGLLVAVVSLGVLAMHQVPHTLGGVDHAVSQHHEGHHAPPPSDQDGPAQHDTMTHMCVGLIVVIAGLMALALVALLRREHEGQPRPSALRWLRHFPGRAPPPHRLSLAACGGTAPTGHTGHPTTSTGSSTGTAANNAEDVAFATGMVPHHQQAVEMADLIPSRSTNPKLINLGERVRKAQQPEIDKMTGWLKKWGASALTGHEHHTGHGDMAGMMTPQQITELKAAKGVEFDRMWLKMMIEHHKGALYMARVELTKGSDADAKKLAQEIVDSQQKEIDEMTVMLAER